MKCLRQLTMTSFITSKTMPEDNVIEFFVRIRMDGSGIDRLYRIEPSGLMYVWDDGNWDDMGNPDNDLQSYDKMLDDIEDVVPKTHMPVDTETALLIAALLDNEPLIAHRIDKLQPEEHKMIVDAQPEIDWELMDEIIMPDEEASMWDYDDSLTAAGEAPSIRMETTLQKSVQKTLVHSFVTRQVSLPKWVDE
jgi:hypothetical protein